MKKSLAFLLSVLFTLSAGAAHAEADAVKPVILVVSFGTSYNDTRDITIGAIEEKVASAFPDYEVRRAFTSGIIIKKLAARDGLVILNVTQAMDKLVADGVKQLVIQPTHVMNGFEYDEMISAITPYQDKFESFKVGVPLLTSISDYQDAVSEIMAETPSDEGQAIVFMGHGTEHFANATYAALDYRFKADGYQNVFVGTVEGYPDLAAVMKAVASSGATKVKLLPLMIVAGDHANNDMAGDDKDSWKTQFKAEGYEVDCVLKGLGEYAGIQDHFVEHVRAAIEGAQPQEK
ncbi:MAG: sirohydrochlorin cobaltochelatase [Clostridia bacterium]